MNLTFEDFLAELEVLSAKYNMRVGEWWHPKVDHGGIKFRFKAADGVDWKDLEDNRS